MPSTSPSDLRVRQLRDAAISTILQIAVAGLIFFLILRVAAPWLVSLHDTPSLWLAGLLLLACPLVLVQLAYVLWRRWRRLSAAPGSVL